jgi:hypothetical protein
MSRLENIFIRKFFQDRNILVYHGKMAVLFGINKKLDCLYKKNQLVYRI